MSLRLVDLPRATLDVVAESLAATFPPATVTDPTELSTEEARYRLAFKAGQASVVEKLKNIIKAQKRQEGDGG